MSVVVMWVTCHRCAGTIRAAAGLTAAVALPASTVKLSTAAPLHLTDGLTRALLLSHRYVSHGIWNLVQLPLTC